MIFGLENFLRSKELLWGKFLKQYWTRAHHKSYDSPCNKNIKDPQEWSTGRTLNIVNYVKSNGNVISMSMVVNKILKSLTLKFNYIICSIKESNGLTILNLDELHGSLLVHEKRIQEFPSEERYWKLFMVINL